MKGRRRSKLGEEIETAQAFTVTVDINDFSKQPVDTQFKWYLRLKDIISRVLRGLDIQIAKTPAGVAFWSPGGDGGTLSIVKGGAALAMQFALRTGGELKTQADESTSGESFEVTIGIDRGVVHIGWDLNGSPNVWGDAINNSNRISSTCDSGQILASEGFIDELRSQTREMDPYIDRNYLDPEKKCSQKRLAKHGRFFKVVNLYDAKARVGQFVSGDIHVHVADFEAPFEQMVSNYFDHLEEVIRSKSGVWTLLLARRLYDIGKLTKARFDHYVQKVSLHGGLRDPDHPRDQFFSNFGQSDLQLMMHQGQFKRLANGEELCRQGDVGDDLYVIARGRLGIHVGDAVVAIRETGHMVGEMALVEAGYLRICSKNPVRTAGMVARGDVTVFAIPFEAVRKAAKGSDEVLMALVRSYRERQKENAVKKAACLRLLGSEDIEFICAEGKLEGLPPGTEKIVEYESDGLVICCHGTVKVQRGRERRVLCKRADGSMESIWVSGRSAAKARRIVIKADVPSEVLLWHGQNWREWLRSTPNRNLGGLMAEACGDTL